jgi:hypothetical protein
MAFAFPVIADSAALIFSNQEPQQTDYSKFETKDVSSEWEHLIAKEVIATGQMLDSDSQFDQVVLMLSQRMQSLLPDGSNLTQGWIKDNLQELLPQFVNAPFDAAMGAATNEFTIGAGSIANDLARSQVGLSEQDSDLGIRLKHTALRGGLEGAKAAATASDIYVLNHLEFEYSLTEGGIDEYSILSVQPLWESLNSYKSVFAQASLANKEVNDIGADTSGRRDTLNAGLSYRYITSDEQHMFGANVFFDHQWPYHHNRMSLGLDYKNSLYGVAFNKYFGLSDWRGRGDGFEEKSLGGEDLELSGRLAQAPELEVFVKGFRWGQEKTDVLNPDGGDIWGYQFAAEYTPINAFTVRTQAMRDNDMDDMEGQITMRLNYSFGEGWSNMWERPSHNLDSVLDRRFEKVRRNNEIRVQVRQDSNITARVIFAQGANVTVGQVIAFGTLITTGGAVGDSATIIFGNGARLDIGQNTQVRIEKDKIVLVAGFMQFTTGSGGITVIAVPGGTIDLIGTDVDVRVAGATTTLRVRDGAADFVDDTGTTRVNAEQLAEAQDGDGLVPQVRGEGTAIYQAHASEAHAQLDLVGPEPSNTKAAPYADEAVSVTGTLASGNTLTFTVPLTRSVNVIGTPQLRFTLGGLDRLANYASGSGTQALVFTYDVVIADGSLSNIVAEEIEKNGGTLIGANGAPMVRTVSGTLSGTVPVTIILGQPGCPAGDLSAPANSGCARLFGVDPTDTNDVMIYAGDVPGTATDFFVRRCDLGQDYDPVDERCESGGSAINRSNVTWKDNLTESDTVNASSGSAWTVAPAVDGPANTAALVADVSGTHTAAEGCNFLPGGGWYLPAISELSVLYSNLYATDDTDHPILIIANNSGNADSGTVGPLRDSFTSANPYWSSTEINNTVAMIVYFTNGAQGINGFNKQFNRFVRCARR